MRKGLVGLGHPVGVFLLLERVARAVVSVGQLAREGMRETDTEILDIMLED